MLGILSITIEMGHFYLNASQYSVFETTIRYVGGFLSAYELSGEKYPILIQKAKEVADKMAFAWSAVSIHLI